MIELAPGQIVSYAVGIATGMVTPMLLQGATPPDTEGAVIKIVAGVLTTVVVTRFMSALNKLADSPAKEDWQKMFATVYEIDKKVSSHLSAYAEWKASMEGRMSREEDKES